MCNTQYAQSQARSQAENESLEVLLKQLIADRAEGFYSYEEVAKRRQERAKDVQRMREADVIPTHPTYEALHTNTPLRLRSKKFLP